MKLTSEQVARTTSQFEVQVLPDSHPAVPQLKERFGEHTFLLDSNGLNILEPADTSPRDPFRRRSSSISRTGATRPSPVSPLTNLNLLATLSNWYRLTDQRDDAVKAMKRSQAATCYDGIRRTAEWRISSDWREAPRRNRGSQRENLQDTFAVRLRNACRRGCVSRLQVGGS
jgi:hypothetical protein